MRRPGHLRHLGFSSHTPAVAQRLLDTGLMDMMMFSINPAYDLEQGDEFALGSSGERAALFHRCQAEGVGISVMKPFFAGKLLSEAESPFHQALTRFQCLQYALDRPGDALAASHYGKLSVNASACISCGHCAARCPFGVDQPSRMEEIARYFA